MDNTHPNSIEALKASAETLSLRERLIYDCLMNYGQMTDREVKEKLGYADMNNVRPRITQLIKAGLAHEIDSAVCPVTHRTVRITAPVRIPKQLELTPNANTHN